MSEDLAGDLMIGAKRIGGFVGANERQTFHMLESGLLPGFKIGSKWAAKKSTLKDHIDRLEKASTVGA